MKPLAISGMGLVGAFGCGSAALKAALGGALPVPQQVDLRGAQLPVYRADTQPLGSSLSERALRRIDHFSQLALLGAREALAEADRPELDRSRLGLIIGSGFGPVSTAAHFHDTAIIDGDEFASPTAFSNSVHNAAAAHVSIWLKISGPTMTVCQLDMSYISALLTASQWLDEGRVDAVLLGIVDEYSDLLGYCWKHYSGGAVAQHFEPLQLDRTTAIAGEGAAFFLLEAAQTDDDRPQLQGLQMGGGIDLPAQGPLLLACDGFAETGKSYAELLASARRTACFTQLYGSSPVAPAFDLAVAALAVKEPQLLGSAFAGGQIHCLRHGFVGVSGHVQVGL